MTAAPATFGDFLSAARDQLAGAADRPSTVAPGRDLEEQRWALAQLVRVLARYTGDLTAMLQRLPGERLAGAGVWQKAAIQAHDFLSSATAALSVSDADTTEIGEPASRAARSVHAAAVQLTGRDLLQGHFTTTTSGARLYHSGWAITITTPQVQRALLAEIASLSLRAADTAEAMTARVDSGEPTLSQQRIATASEWLRLAGTQVRAAASRWPPNPAWTQILAAVPVNAMPAAHLPRDAASAAELCQMVTTTAQRARHAAWAAAQAGPQSPAISVTSWHRIAETCMVTSHNCSVLYGTLADRVGQEDPGLSQDLRLSAAQAHRAREEWLDAAREFVDITTEVRGPMSPAAAEAADLALWTGKLAYTDPDWALPDGPSHPHRLPSSLAPQLADVPRVADAIHEASQACASLAAAKLEQASRAVEADRVLIHVSRTARYKVASGRTIPMPVQPASGPYIASLLACCRNTAHTAAQAADAAAGIAARTAAPSRVLAAAKAVARQQPQFWLWKHPAASGPSDSQTATPKPGPAETSLRDLGVTDTRLLWRGKSIDQAAQQVADEAAAKLRGARQSRALAECVTGPTGKSTQVALLSRDLSKAARRAELEAEP